MSATLTPDAIVDSVLSMCGNYWTNHADGPNDYEDLRTLIFDAITLQTASKDERIRQLEAWKEDQIKTFSPLLDYGQSPESGIPLGRSIVEYAVIALKAQKEKDARIKDLEQQSAIKHERIIDLENECKALEEIKEGKDARIAELEREREEWKERAIKFEVKEVRYRLRNQPGIEILRRIYDSNAYSMLIASDVKLFFNNLDHPIKETKFESAIIECADNYKLLEKVEQLEIAAQLLGETGIQLQKERDHAFQLLERFQDWRGLDRVDFEELLADNFNFLSSRENKNI